MGEHTEITTCKTEEKQKYCPAMGSKGPLGTLTLKVPVMTAADDIHKKFFGCFSEKIRLYISGESSARQRIHVKNQALFSSKDKSRKLKYRLGRFPLFQVYRIFAYLFSKLSVSTFYKVISKFQEKVHSQMN